MSLPPSVQRVINKVLGRDGHLDQRQRLGAFRYSESCADLGTGEDEPPLEIDPQLEVFIEKITTYPYKVVDRDIEHIKSLGFSEDQIFEMTVAVALGAGSGRLSLTRRLIKESQQ